MLLAIDVGNTNIVFGTFEDDHLRGRWRISTCKTMTSDEIGILMIQLMAADGLQRESVSGIIISSVVPSLDQALQEMAKKSEEVSGYNILEMMRRVA